MELPAAFQSRDSHRPEPAAKRARDDSQGVSEQEILRLVAERERLRQQRRFEESDSIREELRSMGVELYDKEKEWRTGDGRRGVLFTAGSTECWLSDAEIREQVDMREEARRGRDFDMADRIRDSMRSQGVELKDKESVWMTATGRSGSYSGGPAGGTIHGSEIRKLVAERERFRAEQDFDAADEVRDQLRQRGVELFDNEKTWRSKDGQHGIIITGGHEVNCRYSEVEIKIRIAQREEARSDKNWEQADSIRDELRRNGVELLDNQKRWSTTDGRHGNYADATRGSDPGRHGAIGHRAAIGGPMPRSATPLTPSVGTQYARFAGPPPGGDLGSSFSGASLSGASLSDASIAALVYGRELHRDQRDFQGADAIRVDLRAAGVEVWDKNREWKASDGRRGPIRGPKDI